MKFELLLSDNEWEIWRFGSWEYRKNKRTGKGEWKYENKEKDYE